MPFRQCPGWQCRNTLGLLMLVQFDPHLSEVVKVTAETKTATGPLKGLGLRTGHCILIISPLFTTAAVAFRLSSACSFMTSSGGQTVWSCVPFFKL